MSVSSPSRRLEGLVAAVTGAGGAIGAEIARELARHGELSKNGHTSCS
tara:strand:- start:16 stop:159 length:144 start_codon:yes stop_codon:yes gene_type:complete